ncbi:respiratory chain complex I subunit 1 family protein [Microbacter margulisiae]|uniref:Formate hydrogenlyase subunit 4 n=1 Tax=Microbacter margulisiae TaxID=1350067 RepID=A0A7W5H0S2_9PORP|nr:NADH-quinone oxidoreductase subunit H [Microbacter margulisiae]MBB3186858.1 formate hydrogenlyase subunit 4 [Microbacter margulisiae]
MISFIVIIVTSLFISGIIVRTKSICSGRKGSGIMQPMRDILKLWKKGSVYSHTSSWIFRIAPTVYFSSILMAAAALPLGGHCGLFSFDGDFVFFAYVLATGKFFNIIAALDTGSSFEGMGASREALFSMLAEPAFFLLMGSLSLLTGYTSFNAIFQALHFGSYITYALTAIATFILLMLAMIENSRMPIDDPKTHLELTMIHEVMILDNSGFDLGLIFQATNFKFVIYGALIANMFLGNLPLYDAIPMFLGIQVVFGICIGLIESFMARYRMTHNAQFVLILSSLSLLVLFGVLMLLNKFNS